MKEKNEKFIKNPQQTPKKKSFSITQFIRDIQSNDEQLVDIKTMDGFIKLLIMRIKSVDVTGLASQLAFFFLLSLFPLLIFLITLLPFLNMDQAQLFLYIREYAPVSVANLIESTLGEVLKNRNSGLLSVGIIATIWSASKGMNALTKALNRSYFVENRGSFYITRGMSIVFTVMLIAVLVSALVLPIFGQQIGMFVFSYLGLENNFLQVWGKLRLTIPPLLIFVVFLLVYWIVPNIKLSAKSVIPGAVFSTVGWIVTSYAFSFYVGNFSNYSNTYGSIGTIIVLMMWLYFSGIILMIGGQINAVMLERAKALKTIKLVP